MVYNILMDSNEKALIWDARGGWGRVINFIVAFLFGLILLYTTLLMPNSITIAIAAIVFFCAGYELYGMMTPLKNPVFTNYGDVKTVVKMLDEIMVGEKRYEDDYIMVTNNYLMSKGDYSSIRRLQDVVMVSSYTSGALKGGIKITDKWGVATRVSYGFSIAKARMASEELKIISPKIKIKCENSAPELEEDEKTKKPTKTGE